MSEDAKLSYTIGNFTVVPTTPTTEIKSYCTSSAGQRAFVEDTTSCYQFFHGLFGKWNTHRKDKLSQEEELKKLYGSPNIPSPQKKKNWKKFLTLYLVLGTIVLAVLLALLFHRTKTVERTVTETTYKGKGADIADIADTDGTRKGKKKREEREGREEGEEREGRREEETTGKPISMIIRTSR